MAVARAGRAAPGSRRTGSWLRGLTLVTFISVFALVVLGGVVRVTGSGLGCPDWPLCHGGLLPPLETKAIIEFTHRFVASVLVGPLIIVTCLSAWVFQRNERWLIVPATAALVLLVLQALLGGYTVLNELPGIIVLVHLAVGQGLLGCLTLMTVVAYRGPLRGGPQPWAGGKLRRFPSLSIVAAAVVFGLMLSGSWVTISGSTGACLDWPLCNGDAFPSQRLQMIHMVHRYVALVIGLLVLYTLHLGFRGRTQPTPVRMLSLAGAALFVGQVLVGAGAVWTDFSQEFRALHLALATGVWAAVAALAFVVYTGKAETGSAETGRSPGSGHTSSTRTANG